MIVQEQGRAPRPLPADVQMGEVYDDLGGTLLILGAPGTGKTTMLLELADELLERADADPAHPIPVVFNLSSWAARPNALAEWLVDELNLRYDVPRKTAQAWVDEDEILPLLDGLDEVAQVQREACAQAINAYRAAHGLVPLAVCSREEEYGALGARLRLGGAVRIRPLTPAQVDGYLDRAGVREALQADRTLYELFETPLMLSVAAMAYQGAAAGVIGASGTTEERRGQLYAAYVEEMFRRRTKESRYGRAQSERWLAWLAGQMAAREQTVFYLERMQPRWLPAGAGQRAVAWAPAAVGGLIFGLIFGLVDGLFGVLAGGLFGVLGAHAEETRPAETLSWSWQRARAGLVVGLIGGLYAMLVVGLFAGLVFGWGACQQHLALRLLLWRGDLAPLDYVRFLDYAAERVLLRKVGGGYIFLHRTLMEWFARRWQE